MPISCPKGEKPRYRFKGKVRLAFCGNNKVVEAKKFDKKGGLRSKAKERRKSNGRK